MPPGATNTPSPVSPHRRQPPPAPCKAHRLFKRSANGLVNELGMCCTMTIPPDNRREMVGMISKSALRSTGGTSNRDQFVPRVTETDRLLNAFATGTESFGAPVTVSQFLCCPHIWRQNFGNQDFWISAIFEATPSNCLGMKSTAPHPTPAMSLCAFHRHRAHHDDRDGILVMIC